MSTHHRARPGSIDAVAQEILEILDRPDPLATARNAAQAIAQARDAGDGALRQQHLQEAQAHIAQIDLRQRRAIQQLQGQVLAVHGRGGDTRIAHVSPGEVVVPRRVLDPELASQLAEAMRNAGLDPSGRVVGSRRARRNPRTGHEEFNSSDDELDPSWQTPWTPHEGNMGRMTVTGSRGPSSPISLAGDFWYPQVGADFSANLGLSASDTPINPPDGPIENITVTAPSEGMMADGPNPEEELEWVRQIYDDEMAQRAAEGPAMTLWRWISSNIIPYKPPPTGPFVNSGVRG